MTDVTSVLFVCWANVCRSPAAELLLKREVKRRGQLDVRIESAGVCADADTAVPSFFMRWATLRRGIWLRPSPRHLQKQDLQKYDLIIAMDHDVLYSIRTIGRNDSTNVKLLSEFLPEGWPVNVPDPMRRSVAKCNRVLDMLDQACRAICLNHLSTSNRTTEFQVQLDLPGPKAFK